MKTWREKKTEKQVAAASQTITPLDYSHDSTTRLSSSSVFLSFHSHLKVMIKQKPKNLTHPPKQKPKTPPQKNSTHTNNNTSKKKDVHLSLSNHLNQE